MTFRDREMSAFNPLLALNIEVVKILRVSKARHQVPELSSWGKQTYLHNGVNGGLGHVLL